MWKLLKTSNVIYKADITTNDNNETKQYIGMTANNFKERYRNLKKSFQDPKRNKRKAKHCNLCLEEKLLIMKADKKFLLNNILYIVFVLLIC